MALAISYQWPPDWWRSCTWPEFKTIMFMRNEHDEMEARREESEDDPLADVRAKVGAGGPPSEKELAVIPRAV